jgi:hypothetical protein
MVPQSYFNNVNFISIMGFVLDEKLFLDEIPVSSSRNAALILSPLDDPRSWPCS